LLVVTVRVEVVYRVEALLEGAPEIGLIETVKNFVRG